MFTPSFLVVLQVISASRAEANTVSIVAAGYDMEWLRQQVEQQLQTQGVQYDLHVAKGSEGFEDEALERLPGTDPTWVVAIMTTPSSGLFLSQIGKNDDLACIFYLHSPAVIG